MHESVETCIESAARATEPCHAYEAPNLWHTRHWAFLRRGVTRPAPRTPTTQQKMTRQRLETRHEAATRAMAPRETCEAPNVDLQPTIMLFFDTPSIPMLQKNREAVARAAAKCAK